MPYIRKFAGPRRPGEHSAKVPGLSSKRWKAASKIQAAWRKRNRASRFAVSRARYEATRAVAKAQSNYGENKFQGYKDFARQPVPKPGVGDAPMSYVFYNSGYDLSAQLPEYTNNMGLFKFQQGDGNDQRQGNYMYIRKTHLKFEIQMLPTQEVSQTNRSLFPQVDFRVMLVKANRKYDSLGKFNKPGDTLFLTPFNNTTGYLKDISAYELMRQPINKKNWIVYRDQKFTLNTPVVETQAIGVPESIHNNALSTKNTKKEFKMSLPVWKKCHFNNSDTAELNVPDNVDTQWLLIVQACYTNHSYDTGSTSPAPRNFKINLLGTTTARDS